MGTIIVVIVLAIIVLFAISSSVRHMKGEGGCCGGGSEGEKGILSRLKKKKLDSAKMGEMEVHIEGMHCENCKRSVERAVDELEGVVCKVNLKKGTAKVEYSREISDKELREAIEREGFQVREMIRK